MKPYCPVCNGHHWLCQSHRQLPLKELVCALRRVNAYICDYVGATQINVAMRFLEENGMKLIDRYGANARHEFENLILEAEDQMTKQWDIDFVTDMKENYKKFGVHTWMSDKQLNKLKEIASGEGQQDTYDRFSR